MNLQQFQYDGRTVRVQVDENGKEWFCAQDVTGILGFANGRDAVEKHCEKDGVAKRYITDRLGREQAATFIDEGNLYRLITRSHLPQAKEFGRWLFDTVIPAIRKTGTYSASLPKIPQTHLETARQLVSALETVMEMTPKAVFYDAVMQSDDDFDMHEVAKVLNLGFGRNTLFQKLRADGIIMDNNAPYQRYVDLGYFRLVESTYVKPDSTRHISTKTVCTQKGLDFIHRRYSTKTAVQK